MLSAAASSACASHAFAVHRSRAAGWATWFGPTHLSCCRPTAGPPPAYWCCPRQAHATAAASSSSAPPASAPPQSLSQRSPSVAAAAAPPPPSHSASTQPAPDPQLVEVHRQVSVCVQEGGGSEGGTPLLHAWHSWGPSTPVHTQGGVIPATSAARPRHTLSVTPRSAHYAAPEPSRLCHPQAVDDILGVLQRMELAPGE